jgi:DNA-binding NtrC family response regulator
MTEPAAAPQLEFTTESTRREHQLLVLGHSQAFRRLQEALVRLGHVNRPVLLRGEEGVGREHIARSIHRAGSRARQPLVVVSCGSYPETLLETELFGCLKGAVVGASSDRHGVLDIAHGGSVYLEDVDQIGPRVQALLVGFLETGDVRKVGAFGPGTPSDVRVIASITSRPGTSRPAGAGALRPDLLAAFIGGELTVPPLRERRNDIPVLADYFARVTTARMNLPVATFSPQAHTALEAYSWPGNVGQLRRVVERVVKHARSGEIAAEDLPVGIRPRLRLAAQGAGGRRSVAEVLLARLLTGGESFWACVYPLFLRREITRMDVRELVGRGRELASGCQDGLVRLFNMPTQDRARFERFLRRYNCEVAGIAPPSGSLAPSNAVAGTSTSALSSE